MYGAALKNGAGGDGKQEYFCKVPNVGLPVLDITNINLPVLDITKFTCYIFILQEWKIMKEEEMKAELASNSRYKSYRRYMKKGGPGQMSFGPE